MQPSRVLFCALSSFFVSLSAPAQIQNPWQSPEPINPASMTKALSCVQSVCGPATQNLGAEDTRTTRLATPALNYLRAWDEKFEASLRELVASRKKASTQAEARLQRWHTEPFLLDTTQPDFALHNFRQISAPLAKLESLINRTKAGNLEIQPKLYASITGALPAPSRVAVELLVKKLLLPDAELIYFTRAHSPGDVIEARAKLRYPGLSRQEGMKHDGRKLMRQLEQISGVLGKSYTDVLFAKSATAAVEKLAAGDELTNPERILLAEVSKKIERAAAILSDPEINAALLAIPSDLEVARQQFYSPSKLEALLKRWQSANTAKESAEISAKCRANLHESLELSTSRLRIAQSRMMIEEIRKASLRVALSLADEATAPALIKKINSIRFILPEDGSARFDLVRAALQKDQELVARLLDLLNDPEARAERGFVSLMLSHSLTEQFAHPLTVRTTCVDLPRETINDYAKAQDNIINVSWFALNYPRLGVGIVAHEVGHIASSVMKITASANAKLNPRFAQARACVDKRNPYVKSAAVAARSPYVEEDFADFFGSTVLNELKAQGSPWALHRNVGCALRLDNGADYEILFRPALMDPHSTAFFRLLMIANDTHAVTPECQPFIEELRGMAPVDCHP